MNHEEKFLEELDKRLDESRRRLEGNIRLCNWGIGISIFSMICIVTSLVLAYIE